MVYAYLAQLCISFGAALKPQKSQIEKSDSFGYFKSRLVPIEAPNAGNPHNYAHSAPGLRCLKRPYPPERESSSAITVPESSCKSNNIYYRTVLAVPFLFSAAWIHVSYCVTDITQTPRDAPPEKHRRWLPLIFPSVTDTPVTWKNSEKNIPVYGAILCHFSRMDELEK